jgi:hypothetical protein
MKSETDAHITGAAVTFDPAALRSWLHEPAGQHSDRADDLGIGELFSRAHGGLLAGLDGLLAALADDNTQTVWRLEPGVEYVGLFRTFDGDGCDGAIIVADLHNRLRLASLHQDPRDFASRESHGVPAAVEALTHLAVTANHIVDQYRLSRVVAGPDQPAGTTGVVAVLNAVADDLLEVADAGDEGLRDALNLTVNAALVYLEHGWIDADPAAARNRLEQVATSNYDEDLDTILGWIDAGIR